MVIPAEAILRKKLSVELRAWFPNWATPGPIQFSGPGRPLRLIPRNAVLSSFALRLLKYPAQGKAVKG